MSIHKHLRPFALAATIAGISFASFTESGMAAETAGKNFVPVAKMSAPTPPPGGIGWQKVFTVDIPTGRNLIYTDSCPDDAKVPLGNSFNAVNGAKTGLELVSSFRSSTTPQQWQWEIHWPHGAPANSRIYFNIYCTTQ